MAPAQPGAGSENYCGARSDSRPSQCHSFTAHGVGPSGVVVFARTFHVGAGHRNTFSVFHGARDARDWRALLYRSHRSLPLLPVFDVHLRVFSQNHGSLSNARVLCWISWNTWLVCSVAARIASVLENSGYSMGFLPRHRDCNAALSARASTARRPARFGARSRFACVILHNLKVACCADAGGPSSACSECYFRVTTWELLYNARSPGLASGI